MKARIPHQLAVLMVLLGLVLATAAIAAEPDQSDVEYEAYQSRRQLQIHLTAYALKTFGEDTRLVAMLRACDLTGLAQAIRPSEEEVVFSLKDELVNLSHLSPAADLTPFVVNQTTYEAMISIESASLSLGLYGIGFMESTLTFLSIGLVDRETYCAGAAKQADRILSERSEKAADEGLSGEAEVTGTK